MIPAGARVLGTSSPVQAWGESRLAVSFHRLVMPDGQTHRFDRFKGLGQIGDTGLTDRVNRHYWQVFGASIAIGALSGLAQLGTQTGVDGTTFGESYRQGVGASLAASTGRVLDRYLNILPTLTIREGYRIKVYLTNDLDLPTYASVSRRCPMTRTVLRLLVVSLLVLTIVIGTPTPTRAQFVVYDPANWAQAVLQVTQLVDQLRFWLRQARRLPIDMVSRYHGHSVDWTLHDLDAGLLFARRILTALNTGDPTGVAYRQTIDPLEVPTDVLGRMPASLQRRSTNAYAALELADSVSALAIDQMGAMRVEGRAQRASGEGHGERRRLDQRRLSHANCAPEQDQRCDRARLTDARPRQQDPHEHARTNDRREHAAARGRGLAPERDDLPVAVRPGVRRGPVPEHGRQSRRLAPALGKD